MSNPENPRPPQNSDNVKSIRCAVYTRKSTSEGLEQEFNSLDAQRETAEAYIVSQKHKGWRCLEDQYNDGGHTGADMKRPALQRLLNDIRENQVDCIVVYKIDRLSRSLMDFGRIVDILDQHGCSFVSVTQQFNTTSSMGRLTLNVLLSFAQFEREIISERTRDKIAAARRKGKWTGGAIPLGYDLQKNVTGSRLIVNPKEAERVRTIFATYLERHSLRDTVEHITRLGHGTKLRQRHDGSMVGNKPFNKSRVSSILHNPIYVGKIRHREHLYPGQHEPIIMPDQWDRIQSLLAEHRPFRNSPRNGKNRFPLAGIIRCGVCDGVMTPTFTSKGSRRYRYYTCRNRQTQNLTSCQNPATPATELERFIQWKLLVMYPIDKGDIEGQPQTLSQKREYFLSRLKQISFDGKTFRIRMDLLQHDMNSFSEVIPFHYSRGPKGQKMLREGYPEKTSQKQIGHVPRVSRLLALAIRFEQQIHSGKVASYADLARRLTVTRARMSQITSLLNLAPNIQEQILELPRRKKYRGAITLKQVLPITQEPDWTVQRKIWKKFLVHGELAAIMPTM